MHTPHPIDADFLQHRLLVLDLELEQFWTWTGEICSETSGDSFNLPLPPVKQASRTGLTTYG